jgi:Tol biopolymer transport system component
MDQRGFTTASAIASVLRRPTVVAITLGLLCAALLPGCAFLSRASETIGGVQANVESFHPAISADGRWVAFMSNADNLVAGDTNQQTDVFVRDNLTKAVSRVSVTSAGGQTAGPLCNLVSISDDGRIVAFTNCADDLTANDSNGSTDVFWHDRDADRDGIYDEPGAIATVLASARPDGTSGNGDSLHAALNADGSVLAFTSRASDLLAAPDQDTNGHYDVFASTFDLTTGQRTSTRIVSRQPGNTLVEANEASQLPSIDTSGDIIAFETLADNLVPGDTNNVADVAVNDGFQIRRGSGAVQPNGRTWRVALSRDGTHVAYVSRATNLVPGDNIANNEVFVTDYAGTGLTSPARQDYTGAHTADAGSYLPSISADGSRVAYTSADPGIVTGDTNGHTDVFVHDFDAGITQRASTNMVLQEAALGSDDGFLQTVALSAGGQVVAFSTQADLLTPDANGQQSDVLVRGAMVPVIDSVAAIDPVTHAEGPAVLHPGANQLVVRGGGFGADVDVLLGVGITVTSTTEAAVQVLVSVNVASGTPAGVRDLVVHNRGTTGALAAGTFQRCQACVTIAAN